MRRALTVPLLLLLAGCATPPADDPGAAAGEPSVFASDLVDCELTVAGIPAPASRFGDRVPDGFRLLTPSEAGFPNDPRGDAVLGVEMLVCEDGFGGSGVTAYGSYFAFVEPPAELAQEGTLLNFLKWETLVNEPRAREALLARGAPAFEGATAYSPRFQTGEGAQFVGTMTMNGTHTFRGSALAPAEDEMRNFTFVEYTPLADGSFAVWRANPVSRTLGQGAAEIDLPPGFARTVAGAERVQAYLLVGQTSFLDATLTIPPPRAP